MKILKPGVQVQIVLSLGLLFVSSVNAEQKAQAQPERGLAQPEHSLAQPEHSLAQAPHGVAEPQAFAAAPMPTEASAVKDVQAFLNTRTDAWEVQRIKSISSEFTSIKGVQVFVMDSILDVKIGTSITPKETDMSSGSWLSSLSGKRGESKGARVRLTWVRRASGWKLKALD